MDQLSFLRPDRGAGDCHRDGDGKYRELFSAARFQHGNTFTFLNAGILISIFLNAWLMEIPLKTQLRFGLS